MRWLTWKYFVQLCPTARRWWFAAVAEVIRMSKPPLNISSYRALVNPYTCSSWVSCSMRTLFKLLLPINKFCCYSVLQCLVFLMERTKFPQQYMFEYSNMLVDHLVSNEMTWFSSSHTAIAAVRTFIFSFAVFSSLFFPQLFF